eukprot:4305676-Pyramimonas_sp.AAC.1
MLPDCILVEHIVQRLAAQINIALRRWTAARAARARNYVLSGKAVHLSRQSAVARIPRQDLCRYARMVTACRGHASCTDGPFGQIREAIATRVSTASPSPSRSDVASGFVSKEARAGSATET